MYTIRHKHRIVGSDLDQDKAIDKYLAEVGKNPEGLDTAAAKKVIKGCLDRNGNFKWGKVEIVKD